jgi:hypothetical protein
MHVLEAVDFVLLAHVTFIRHAVEASRRASLTSSTGAK